MKVNKVIESKKEVLYDIICDCCEKSCMVLEGVIDNPVRIDNGEVFKSFEFMSMEVHWGYYSGKDTEKWTAQVCEKCIDEKFKFVKFKKENYL